MSHASVPGGRGSAVLRELEAELLGWVQANSQAGASVEVGLDTPLFGERAILDSVALISFVLLIEERLGCTVEEPETLVEGDDPPTIRTVVEACAKLLSGGSAPA